MIKALFFDIDGTLVSFHTHRIPQSAVDALRDAKERGVKVYISTGRPVDFINNLQQIENLIDGYVTTTGALCIVGKEKFGCHSISPQSREKIIGAARRLGKACMVVGTEGTAVINDSEEVTRQFREGLNLYYDFYPLNEILLQPTLQLTAFFTDEEEAEVMGGITDCVSSRWNPAFTDITNIEADKGAGLAAMCAHEGFKVEEAMAFGDGGNDLSIIRKAGIGVAMGNGRDRVKAAADYVTTSVDEDGISKALRHFGVI